jgi:hypothetical protein
MRQSEDNLLAKSKAILPTSVRTVQGFKRCFRQKHRRLMLKGIGQCIVRWINFRSYSKKNTQISKNTRVSKGKLQKEYTLRPIKSNRSIGMFLVRFFHIFGSEIMIFQRRKLFPTSICILVSCSVD